MALVVCWSAVCLAEEIEMRAGARAAAGNIRLLVDVETFISSPIARDIPRDLTLVGRSLLEGNGAIAASIRHLLSTIEEWLAPWAQIANSLDRVRL